MSDKKFSATGKKGGNTDVSQPLSDAPTNGRNQSQVDVVVKNWTVNIFFDGTGNNRFNTKLRIDSESEQGKKLNLKDKIPKKDNASYENDYSNVARLYDSQPDKEVEGISWIYIQGMGTTEEKPDTEQGMGLGSGRTGIEARVLSAFDEIVKNIKRRKGANYIPAILTLNVFGFSRGAASARHFVNTAKTNPKRFKGWGLNKNRIIVRVVGLFDTVSSFEKYDGTEGTVWELIKKNRRLPDFKNDATELKLAFGQGHALKVFHLTADDEYRKNFDLTDIRSAIAQGCGLEIKLTGAHSDIGGGYAFKEKESATAHNKQLENWFTRKGYFEGKDGYGKNKTTPSRTFEAEGGEHTTPAMYSSGSRLTDYHKVPFKAMHLVAKHVCGNLLNSDVRKITKVVETKEKAIESLLNEKGSLLKAIMAEATKAQWQVSRNLAFDDGEAAKLIRSQYIHWSAKPEIGLGVRLGKNNLPHREVNPG